MSDDYDPKHAASNARRLPQTEKTLRQFLTLETGNFITKKFRQNYDAAMGKVEVEAFAAPFKCEACEYLATNMVEVDFHLRLEGHSFDLGIDE